MATTTTNTDTNTNQSTGYGTGKISWAERLVDRMNPILVKEVRQAMKGRVFVITFLLLIGVCWLISLFGVLESGAALEYHSYAEQFFRNYFIPLAIAIGFIVPFLAHQSLQNERNDDTFEMLSITTLNARKIVSGKLTNAIVLVFLCYAAITPFIAFTSLLQGFRLFPVLLAIIVAFFMSLALCSFSLLVSSLAKKRIMQGILTLGLLIVLGYSLLACGLLFTPEFWRIPGDWTTIGVVGLMCLNLFLTTLFLREITVAMVTFPSDNRTTGVRLMTTIILLTVFGVWYGFYSYNRTTAFFFHEEVTFPIVIFSLFLLIFVGYFSTTEPINMSNRVRQQLAARHPLIRLGSLVWMPGCYRGYLFVLVHLLPILGLCYYLFYDAPTSTAYGGNFWTTTWLIPITIGWYALAYSGIAVIVSTWFYRRNENERSTFVRSIFLVIIAALALIPQIGTMVIEEIKESRIPYGIHLAMSPQSTVYEVHQFAENGIRGIPSDTLISSLFVIDIVAMAALLILMGGLFRTIPNTLNPLGATPTSELQTTEPTPATSESDGEK